MQFYPGLPEPRLSGEAYESLVDQQDGAVAAQRLADIDAGRSQVISADEVERDLGL